MGRAVKEEHGNVTPEAEFNIYVDPEAAKKVYHSGLNITMVGLNVTSKTLLSQTNIEWLNGTMFYDFVKKVTRDYLSLSAKETGIQACAMHDPLAVAVAIQLDIVKTKKYYIDVETNSTLCDGMTVCDLKGYMKKSPNVDVAIEVDVNGFLEIFPNALSKTKKVLN